jgi:hypothetical protein
MNAAQQQQNPTSEAQFDAAGAAAAKKRLLQAFSRASHGNASTKATCQTSKPSSGTSKYEPSISKIQEVQLELDASSSEKCGYHPDQFADTTFQPLCKKCGRIPKSAVAMLCCGEAFCLAAVPHATSDPWKTPCCGEIAGAQPAFNIRKRVESLTWSCLYCKFGGIGLAALEFHQQSCAQKPPTREQTCIGQKLSIISLVQAEQCRLGQGSSLTAAVVNVLSSNPAFAGLKEDTVKRWLPHANSLLDASQHGHTIRRGGGGRHTALDPQGGQEHSLEFQRLWEEERSKKHEPGRGITNSRFWQVLTTFFRLKIFKGSTTGLFSSCLGGSLMLSSS